MTKAQKADRDEARALLRKHLAPGDVVYTILRHVSRSGMMRVVSLHILTADGGGMWDISGLAARATGRTLDRGRFGLRMDGCGTDMGFEAVYSLSVALFCPDKYEHDGAYALRQRWI